MPAAPLRRRELDGARIAVLRANRLGDLVLALPALEALRAAHPAAELTLLGAGWHPQLLDGRPGPWDRVVVVPGCPGVRDTDTDDHDPAALAAFFAAQRRERYDLAVQLHGGGRSSNPFVTALGARTTVGAQDRDAPPLDRCVPYSTAQHEVLRLLEVVALAGAPVVSLEPRLAVTARDVREAAQVLPADDVPLVALHLGASDPRRRWPVERFAAVADALDAAGAHVVVVGSGQDDARAAARLAVACRSRPTDLVGALGLRALTGLLARCRLVVANDSGPRHLAAAVGTPTVGIFLTLNALNAGPVVAADHRVALSSRTACAVCGEDQRSNRCAHDASLVTDVEVDEVLELAIELFAAGRPGAVAARDGAARQPA